MFQICGPKHLKLLLPKVTVFRVWIIRSFFLLITLFLLLNNYLMNEGLRSLRLLKISIAIVLSLLLPLNIYLISLAKYYNRNPIHYGETVALCTGENVTLGDNNFSYNK